MACVEMKIIAHIHSDFAGKFGVPRQSGLVPELKGRIVFTPEYRVADALRGLEDYSHIWLIWQFSEAVRSGWSPTVRPPRLGGNKRMGVFATRSPFRPNNIGLSAVKLEGIDYTDPEGPVLIVSGADLMDGTPLFDIKPYLPYADAHPEAVGGFAKAAPGRRLAVDIAEELAGRLAGDKLEALKGVLACDPRPAYQDDPERIYGFRFADREVKFSVSGDVLTVRDIGNPET